jgi:hypothetical protein
MADTEFNRPTLTSPAVQPSRSGLRGLGVFLVILLLAGAGAVGYKIIMAGVPSVPVAPENRNLAKIQQQLSSIEKRLDRLEKLRSVAHMKSSPSAAEPALAKVSKVVRSPQPAPMNSSANAHAPQSQPQVSTAAPQIVDSPTTNATAADRDAWQATADRLTDVVGAVGSQQAEISQTQTELGQLSAQTRHFAVPFQLHRGSRPQMVGPVSLELKNSDARRQRYSISVFLDDKPVEFKDRAVDEMVDFVLPGESVPLHFVATKIEHNSIAGYMEIPSGKIAR